MLGGTCENDHDGIPPTERPCQRKELLNLLAKRHALAVAVSSVLCKITQCSGEDFSRFVTLNRQLRDLELMLMDIELKVMDLFQHGNDDENARVLFFLMDLDHSGTLDITELRYSLQRFGPGVLPNVDVIIEAASREYGGDCDGLTEDQFGNFLKCLVDDSVMMTKVTSFFQLFLVRVIFQECGRTILEQLVMSQGETIQTIEQFNRILANARMGLLFDILDYHIWGSICTKHVALHLIRYFNKTMGRSAANTVAGMMKKNGTQNMNFDGFSKTILNLFMLFSKDIDFADLANELTLSLSSDDFGKNDIQEFLADHKAVDKALSDDDEAEDAIDCAMMAKLVRLFDLLDLDGSGTLDLSEVVLALRKYQDVEVELSLSIDTATEHILGGDKKRHLSKEEFAHMMIKLAHGSGMEMDRFADFCLVQVALKDCSSSETEFLARFKEEQGWRSRRSRNRRATKSVQRNNNKTSSFLSYIKYPGRD